METTIKIKGDEYKLRYSIKALFTFEEITGKTFAIETLMDNYILFYAFLITSNPETDLSFDDFLAETDENPNLIIEFTEFINKTEEQRRLLINDVKKKKTKDSK